MSQRECTCHCECRWSITAMVSIDDDKVESVVDMDVICDLCYVGMCLDNYRRELIEDHIFRTGNVWY